MPSMFERVKRRTGKKQTSCSCEKCKSQCNIPCLGTPEDIFKLIAAGYENRLMEADWDAGRIMGVTDKRYRIISPLYDDKKKSCTFLTNGLCELHNLGLKPTEGKLSHHSMTTENFDPKKSISWNVIKEWIGLSVKKKAELKERYKI
jgi:hypothetical protein